MVRDSDPSGTGVIVLKAIAVLLFALQLTVIGVFLDGGYLPALLVGVIAGGVATAAAVAA